MLLSAVSTVSGLKSTLLSPINMVHNWESLDTCCEWPISLWTCSKKRQRSRRRDALKTSTREPEKRRWRGWNKLRRKGTRRSGRGLKNFANRWKSWSWGRRRYSEPGQSVSAVKHDFVDVFLKHFFFSLSGNSSEERARGSACQAVGAGEDGGGEEGHGREAKEDWDGVKEAVISKMILQ